LLAFLVTGCKKSTRVVLEEFEPGKPKHEWVREEKVDSMFEYYPNGRLKGLNVFYHLAKQDTPFYWLDGELHVKYEILTGQTIYFYESGQLKRLLNSSGGELQGEQTQWYENGNIDFITEYSRGLLIGMQHNYHKNGLLKKEGLFHYGNAIEGHTFYDTLGRLNRYRYYDSLGKVVYIIHYDTLGNVTFEDGDSNAIYSSYYRR
jgi:antitoxin component YwqK of YwqJK toxin-antitoxin module